MATFKFYLNKPTKENLYPVLLCYQDRGKKFRFSTRVFTTKSSWQKSRLKPTSLKDFESNELLETCEKVIQEIEREALLSNTYIHVEEVEQKFRERIFKTEPYKRLLNVKSPPVVNHQQQSQFFDYYDQFIEASRSTKAKSTIFHYKICKKILMDFEKSLGFAISFETMGNRLYQKFHSYMIDDLKYLNNTVGGHTKNLKVFLNYAMRHKFTELRFDYSDFKTFNEEVDIIALTQAELFRIYNCKNLKPHQDIARDYLCFESFTGLRFSDIGRLRKENIKEDFIVLKTQKTKDQLYIPLNVFAKEILQKYSAKQLPTPLPPTFTNQKVNEYIKEVAELAKINDLTMVEKFSGSNRITITKPKYAFISTHTGRRTFITLSHEMGMQIEMIMKITGIKKWATLKKYLKVSESSKLAKMNEFWNKDMFS